MNKGELIDAVAASTGESKRTVGDVLDSFISHVQDEVKSGNKVSLPGFGTFEKRHRNARTGRNPQTGETIQVAAADVPAFKPGAGFKSHVNG
ncbi:MAG: HU family DNA-binding protein [Actinomycetota bacterium]